MADILSKEEVDLLLSAVAKGEAEVEEGKEERAPAEAAGLVVYDFRRPERVSKEQLKGLQSLFEAFARELSILLPAFLRTVVRVDLASIDQLTYDEFILSIARPTSLFIVNMSPLEGNAIIELSPSLVFPIVDRLLGGRGAPLTEPRDLTEIETRIVNRIVLMILDSLKRSWDQLVEFNLSVVGEESDPLIVQIVAGSEMTILAGYEIHVGDIVGAMNMCIPLLVLNPVLDQISAQTRHLRKMSPETARRTQEQIVRTLRKAAVPVSVILGRAQLPLSDIARLQVGDTVQLDTDISAPVTVEVAGIPRFLAQPGRVGDVSAVQVAELIRD